MKKLKCMALLLVLALALGTLAGCGSSSSASSDTLKFGCIKYSDSLDPANKINSAWCDTRYGIGECLYRFDDQMNAVPQLAESYDVNDAHTEWVFHIREGVRFSNGADLTATAVKKSIERMYQMEEEGKGSSTVTTYMVYDSIEANDDDMTLTIKTKEAYPDLSKTLASPLFVIINVDDTTDFDKAPIGTGPYAVETNNEGVSIDMVANEYYWNGDVPYAKLEIIYITDNASKTMALKNGDVDVVENITSATDLEEFKNSSDYNFAEAISARCGFAYLNQKGVLANETLRKAVIMAIDDEKICENTIGGLYTPGISVLPSNLDYGYDDLNDATPYDPEAAKTLLDNAGIRDTDGDGYRELDGTMINLDLWTYDSRNLTDFAEADAAALEEIGIKCTINVTDADTEWDKLVAGEYDLNYSNWLTVATGDPQEYLDNWYGKSDANYCGYNDETYNSLYEELKKTTDEGKRAEIIEQLQQNIIDNAGVLVCGYYNSNMISRKNVTGATIGTADYYWITADIKPAG